MTGTYPGGDHPISILHGLSGVNAWQAGICSDSKAIADKHVFVSNH
jgi:hypothetical protein